MRQLPLIALCLVPRATAGTDTLVLRTSVGPLPQVAGHRLLDLDGKRGDELFTVSAFGDVATWHFAAPKEGTSPGSNARSFALIAQATGGFRIADPAHAVIALAPILVPGGKTDLAVASRSGVSIHATDERGAFVAEPAMTVSRARMKLRTGVPTFAPLAVDVNGDGRTDLVVPNGEMLEAWIRSPATRDAGAEPFVRAASVRVQVARTRATSADALSEVLESSFTIPSLHLSDVNGDGRPDLLVEDGRRRAFHLVRADGAIPADPDVSVDLSIFQDTTPEAELAPGRTLAGGGAPHMESRDLDKDGIPDYVIAHRRKVWVFRGTKDGPQFQTPSTVLKTADDVTALTLVNLDDDGLADLLLVRVQVPSIAALLRGLVREFDVEVDVAGYRNKGACQFETAPAWKSRLFFRVPAILSIVRDPAKIVSRFEDLGKKFRTPAEGDFDGDGVPDIALVSEDGRELQVWRGDKERARTASESNEVVLRKLVFEDENKTWDIDRLLAWAGGFGERRIRVMTGGAEPSARFELRGAGAGTLISVTPADVDGDDRSELVLRYDSPDLPRTSVFDVVGWKRE